MQEIPESLPLSHSIVTLDDVPKTLPGNASCKRGSEGVGPILRGSLYDVSSYFSFKFKYPPSFSYADDDANAKQ